MRKFIYKICRLIKKRCWYIILLVSSSIYVYIYRSEIYQLKELNKRNIIFIIWLILLLLPLFSEMEFLGVKIKKAVEKETEEVKETLKSIQAQVNNLQLTNSVANNFNFNNSPLPSEQKLEELLQKVTDIQKNYPKPEIVQEYAFAKDDDKSVYLFKIRLDIEKKVHELYDELGYSGYVPISRIVKQLYQMKIIDEMTCDLILQVIKIANRGVHGEIVSEEYIEFVEKTHPEIMNRLQKAFVRVEEYKKWHDVRDEV